MSDFSPSHLRKTVLEMARAGNSVHIACAFSMIEIFSILYTKFVRLNSTVPNHPERDLVCLSKGHGVMAAYACLHELGLVQRSQLDAYFSDGSVLKGLSDAHLPGIEVTGGSLGHGITVATGMALAIFYKNESRRVFCLVGDGEMNEGSVWESLLFAAHHHLQNFILIIDANGHQAMGRSIEVLSCEPFQEKLNAFQFQTWECDGHSLSDLERVLTAATQSTDSRPKAIIARTMKGKGVSFMEDNNLWHYTRLDETQYISALQELERTA